ncbi:hypothetical protein JOQ06_004420 [Pogonophryne albipinna]|uniref:Uncharacterized protein n=1 Tax=Pogonophryne albipinna TaxID=1090488 RepID=A0AAD6AR32_9TELE|nr:hypothetical protein JOQ06_004420 [Pogonophryne albipinna]
MRSMSPRKSFTLRRLVTSLRKSLSSRSVFSSCSARRRCSSVDRTLGPGASAAGRTSSHLPVLKYTKEKPLANDRVMMQGKQNSSPPLPRRQSSPKASADIVRKAPQHRAPLHVPAAIQTLILIMANSSRPLVSIPFPAFLPVSLLEAGLQS